MLARSGNAIEKAQTAVIMRNLRDSQTQLWGGVTKATEDAMRRTASTVAEGENLLRDTVFKGFDDMDIAMRVKADTHIQNYISHTDNGMPLSEKVYRTRAISDGLLEKEIGRSLLLGEGRGKLAKRVVGFVNPQTPGGASYASKRLARTELNSAFHYTQIDQRVGEPWTAGMKWNLSGSHPEGDECDDYAFSQHYRGGESGVFRASDVPGKPHPNCLCYLTTVQASDEEMMRKFLKGDYDSYIDDQIYRYAPDRIDIGSPLAGSPVMEYTEKQIDRMKRLGLTEKEYEERLRKARERGAKRRADPTKVVAKKRTAPEPPVPEITFPPTPKKRSGKTAKPIEDKIADVRKVVEDTVGARPVAYRLPDTMELHSNKIDTAFGYLSDNAAITEKMDLMQTAISNVRVLKYQGKYSDVYDFVDAKALQDTMYDAIEAASAEMRLAMTRLRTQSHIIGTEWEKDLRDAQYSFSQFEYFARTRKEILRPYSAEVDLGDVFEDLYDNLSYESVGGKTINRWWQRSHSTVKGSNVREATDWYASYLSKDVIKDLFPHTPVQFKTRFMVKPDRTSEQRAWYQPWDQTVAIGDSSPVRTVIHEIGHHLENTMPGWQQAANDFLRYRTRGESLTSIYPGTVNAGEMSRRDKFLNPYMGKEYDGKQTEIISMGIEEMFDDSSAFYRKDPEYFSFIYGLLTGRIP